MSANTLALSTSGAASASNSNEAFVCKHGSIPYLTPQTWFAWSTRMKRWLDGIGALEMTMGEEEAPPASQPARVKDYNERRRKAATLLYSATHDNYQTEIIDIFHPADMWQTLRETCDISGSVAVRDALASEFDNLLPSSEDAPIIEFISRLNCLRRQLAGTPEAVDDNHFLQKLLTSLPQRFGTTMDIIQGGAPEQQTIKAVIAKIEKEDVLQRIRCNMSHNNTGTQKNATVLAAHVDNKNRFNKQEHRGQRCGNRGRGHNRDRDDDSAHDNRSKDRSKRARKDSDANEECSYCLRRGHKGVDCRLRKANEARERRMKERGRNTTNTGPCGLLDDELV